MKSLIYGLLAGVLLLGACKKYNEMELNKGDGPLLLSATKSEVVLKQKDDAADALVFNWTAGTNKGTNAAISYVLMLDKHGNNTTLWPSFTFVFRQLTRNFDLAAYRTTARSDKTLHLVKEGVSA